MARARGAAAGRRSRETTDGQETAERYHTPEETAASSSAAPSTAAPSTAAPSTAAPSTGSSAARDATEADLETEIRRRAYERYLSRGDAPGSDVDDWCCAEREVHEMHEMRAGRAGSARASDAEAAGA